MEIGVQEIGNTNESFQKCGLREPKGVVQPPQNGNCESLLSTILSPEELDRSHKWELRDAVDCH